jgi:transcriptional regulator with XRE-family HTH domain
MTISKQVIMARAQAGLSCYETAKRTGLSKGLLSKLENDRDSNPSVNTLAKLAKCYKCQFTIG